MQGLTANLVCQGCGAAVVHEDDVQVLGAVAGGYARPHGGVGVHALTGGRAGQQLGEDLEILQGRQQLFDAHEGNQGIRQGQAHTAVTLRFNDGHGAGFGDTEVDA